MKALVYQGKNKKAIEERQKPKIQNQTDAILKVKKQPFAARIFIFLKEMLVRVPQEEFLVMKALV